MKRTLSLISPGVSVWPASNIKLAVQQLAHLCKLPVARRQSQLQLPRISALNPQCFHNQSDEWSAFASSRYLVKVRASFPRQESIPEKYPGLMVTGASHASGNPVMLPITLAVRRPHPALVTADQVLFTQWLCLHEAPQKIAARLS